MAYSNYADYKSAKPFANVTLGKATFTVVAGRIFDSWLRGPLNQAAPTTPVAPDATNTGAVGVLYGTPAGIATWIKRMRGCAFGGQTILIYDRLSHQAGLSGIVTTAQTTNLPTAALTRYTSGVGVHAALQIYTAVGTGVTTFTCSYTNSAGVAGRTSPLAVIGGTNERSANQILQMPLQQGDVGVRSVESVTVAASTLAAGNFGVLLYKPLGFLILPAYRQQVDWDVVRDGGCLFEPIATDACLCVMTITNTTAVGYMAGQLELVKQI